ncbi:UNVERIFIED_CONTAM: hypothetical protein GTU68_041352 [Idotea baltica]|nr:hypothetical protein [Idotea baltica]
MKYQSIFLTLITFFALLCTTTAQLSLDFEINTNLDVKPISPHIYGINGQDYSRAKSNRQGGNRMTGYNWEHNASHAGEDYMHSSDNFLPFLYDIPAQSEENPGEVLSVFVDASNALGQYSLLTLPMAGYVAADKNGIVSEGETAPSGRWKDVVFEKGSNFSLVPDASDGYIYVDEEINFLLDKYGSAQGATGVKGYSLDNEPALWPFTHPRIHPATPSVNELLTTSIGLATTIKDMDPLAEVFGPALYGQAAYLNFQDAPDWSSYSSDYEWFIDVYLDEMKDASTTAGTRLLDVLDVHWYPEPAGVYSGDVSQEVAEARMQCVRSLWDSSYVEDSWIGQYFSPVAMIPHLQNSIDVYYPGTKLAITEYDYGAPAHISGGIAQVDALGVFGKYGVYMANKWNEIQAFSKAAYDLYLSYDGQGAEFGDMSVFSAVSDAQNSSIYASFESQDPSRLHVIITNKSFTESIAANLNINSAYDFDAAEVFALHDNSAVIVSLPEISFSSNMGVVDIPPLSAYHIVLNASSSTADINLAANGISLFPNPTFGLFKIAGDLSLYDIDILTSQGIIYQNLNTISSQTTVNISDLPAGLYFIRVRRKGAQNQELCLQKILKY